MNKLTRLWTICSVMGVFIPAAAFAMSVDWGGAYRLEYVQVDKTSLGDPNGTKSYILNHLNLSPKIIAADGINVVANLEIFPSSAYPNSQLGQHFGSYLGTPTDSQVANGTQASSNIQVNQLYLNVNNEYGAFLAGRVPLHFGLGITHNSAKGLFDHWFTTHNVVAYKFIIGNLSLMPIYGKIRQESLAAGTEASEILWNLMYENPETESAIGVMYQSKKSGLSSNDAFNPNVLPSGASRIGSWNTTHTNLYLARGFEGFKFRMEAGFNSGGTGIASASGEEIKVSGYGVALEMDFPRPDSKWQWGLRTGIASGDDPKTKDYEGFNFSRNYDVAFLLFNHPMGKFDIFSSNIQRQRDTAGTLLGTTDKSMLADEETIGNALYLAPKLTYTMSDKWDLTNSITWAQLQTNSSTLDIDKNVGFEWDIGMTFKPHEKVRWINEFGFFFPGNAWKEGTNNWSNDFTFGFQSKAAISF